MQHKQADCKCAGAESLSFACQKQRSPGAIGGQRKREHTRKEHPGASGLYWLRLLMHGIEALQKVLRLRALKCVHVCDDGIQSTTASGPCLPQVYEGIVCAGLTGLMLHDAECQSRPCISCGPACTSTFLGCLISEEQWLQRLRNAHHTFSHAQNPDAFIRDPCCQCHPCRCA